MVRNMASELSEGVSSQIVIQSQDGLSLCEIRARWKVSQGAVHGTLKHFD